MANIFQRLFAGRRKALNNVSPGAFRLIGGQLIPYRHNKETYIHQGYMYNDIIYSVVKKILDKSVVAAWAPYQVRDEKAYAESRAILKKISTGAGAVPGDFKRAVYLQSKALVPLDDGRLKELITYPNENETWSELNYGHWGYKLVTGDYYEAGWESGASGGLNPGTPTYLYGLPAQYTSIRANNRLPLTASGYLLQVGTEIEFNKQDILHEKYWNPEWDIYGNQLYGMSPLQAYLMRLQRNNEANLRSAKIAKNAGADDIVFLDDPRLTGEDEFQLALEQTSKLKETWYNEQSGRDNAGKAVWSPFKLGNIKLSLTPEQMELLETSKFDLTMAALVYNAPPVLFSTDASTYNNQSTGERSLTANCAVPLILSREASLQRKLNSIEQYKGKNVVISPDLSCYTELEESKKDQVEWLSKSGLPTYRKYEIMGEERPPMMTDEEWNAVIIPSGFQLLSDLFAAPEDMSNDVNQLTQQGALPYNDEE